MKAQGQWRRMVGAAVLVLLVSVAPASPSAAQDSQGAPELFLPQVGADKVEQPEDDGVAPYADDSEQDFADPEIVVREDGSGLAGETFEEYPLLLLDRDIEFMVRRNGNVTADGSFTGGGADYADMLAVTGSAASYEPGDVLALVADAQLGLAREPNSTTVVGVYSTQPALVGDPLGAWEDEGLSRGDRAMLETLTRDRVPVAMAGTVPVKVTAENGPIMPGDLLTTSSTPGRAMKAEPVMVGGAAVYRPGTILGKAITSLEEGEGVVQMLVMMQ